MINVITKIAIITFAVHCIGVNQKVICSNLLPGQPAAIALAFAQNDKKWQQAKTKTKQSMTQVKGFVPGISEEGVCAWDQ